MNVKHLLARHGAKVPAGVRRHVDADVMAAGVVVLVDALARSREARQRHAGAAALFELVAVHILIRAGAEREREDEGARKHVDAGVTKHGRLGPLQRRRLHCDRPPVKLKLSFR